MPARGLMIVALRILGIWLLVSSIAEGLLTAAFWTTSSSSLPGQAVWSQWLALALALLVKPVLAIGLIYWARLFSYRFYPKEEEESTELTFGKIGSGDLYRIACFILGVYVVVQALPYLVRITVSLFEKSMTWNATRIGEAVLLICAYGALSLFLILGSRGVARFMNSLRHDPDEIPNPQFTVRLLLAGILFMAVIFSLLRLLVR